MSEAFRGRTDAGRRPAGRLADMPADDVVVVVLRRGGAAVAADVAAALDMPLDFIAVRNSGVPFQPEAGVVHVRQAACRLTGARS